MLARSPIAACYSSFSIYVLRMAPRMKRTMPGPARLRRLAELWKSVPDERRRQLQIAAARKRSTAPLKAIPFTGGPSEWQLFVRDNYAKVQNVANFGDRSKILSYLYRSSKDKRR
jgi:hypothetical protein